jgi:CRISPR-associated protein Cas1
MLTLPDWKQKQVLYIQSERGAKNRLFFRNENIVFEKDGEIVNQASCHRVVAVFVMGDFTITSELMRQAKRCAISLFFLTPHGKVYAAVRAQAEGNYLLRAKQYRASPLEDLQMARCIVQNKIWNQYRLLEEKGLETGIDIDSALQAVSEATEEKMLLGLEGSFGKYFFGRYFEEIGWRGRAPRIKRDIPNLLLDMGYTYLFNMTDALLLLFGFDTYKGVYHKLFFQRKSLTCDVMEPFRCLIDRQLRKSFNLGQIHEEDFFKDQQGYSLEYVKSQHYARIFIECIMEDKEALYSYVYRVYRSMMRGGEEFPLFDVLMRAVK